MTLGNWNYFYSFRSCVQIFGPGPNTAKPRILLFRVCRYLPQSQMISPESLPNSILCLFASFVFLLLLYLGLLSFILSVQIFDPASTSTESYLILIRVFPALLLRSNLFVLLYFAYHLLFVFLFFLYFLLSVRIFDLA